MKNIDRFRKDLEALVILGERLSLSMQYTFDRENFCRRIEEVSKSKKEAEATLKALPKFHVEYEKWYSESLTLLHQLLPARLPNFIALYEIPKNRKDLSAANYSIQDALKGLQASRGAQLIVNATAAFPLFDQQLAIVRAASQRFESSLFEIRQLVQADLFDSEMAAARELLTSKFFRAAGAVAGVVLEKHLLQVCSDHSIKIPKKDPGISDLNDLLKGASTIEIPQWRHVSMLADIRNLCAHNKKKEPTEAQVMDLIEGTEKVLKTIF